MTRVSHLILERVTAGEKGVSSVASSCIGKIEVRMLQFSQCSQIHLALIQLSPSVLRSEIYGFTH